MPILQTNLHFEETYKREDSQWVDRLLEMDIYIEEDLQVIPKS